MSAAPWASSCLGTCRPRSGGLPAQLWPPRPWIPAGNRCFPRPPSQHCHVSVLHRACARPGHEFVPGAVLPLAMPEGMLSCWERSFPGLSLLTSPGQWGSGCGDGSCRALGRPWRVGPCGDTEGGLGSGAQDPRGAALQHRPLWPCPLTLLRQKLCRGLAASPEACSGAGPPPLARSGAWPWPSLEPCHVGPAGTRSWQETGPRQDGAPCCGWEPQSLSSLGVRLPILVPGTTG